MCIRDRVVGEQPMQCISETAGFMLLHHDLAEEGGEAAAMIDRWQREEASTPIDLEHGPMIRGRLLRLAEHDHVLLVTMHHIVSDGWSMGILANELDTLYRAYAVQGVAFDVDPLPTLPIQYADYALWQRCLLYTSRCVYETGMRSLANLGLASWGGKVEAGQPAAGSSFGCRVRLIELMQ